MHTDPAITDQAPSSDAQEVIELCGGEPLAAVQALLVANTFLEAEVERLSEAISRGYVRGHLNNGSAVPRLWRGC